MLILQKTVCRRAGGFGEPGYIERVDAWKHLQKAEKYMIDRFRGSSGRGNSPYEPHRLRLWHWPAGMALERTASGGSRQKIPG